MSYYHHGRHGDPAAWWIWPWFLKSVCVCRVFFSSFPALGGGKVTPSIISLPSPLPSTLPPANQGPELRLRVSEWLFKAHCSPWSCLVFLLCVLYQSRSVWSFIAILVFLYHTDLLTLFSDIDVEPERLRYSCCAAKRQFPSAFFGRMWRIAVKCNDYKAYKALDLEFCQHK